jgi:hypothetical protein
MKRTILIVGIFLFWTSFSTALNAGQKPSRSITTENDSESLGLLIGFNSHRATEEPFGALAFPFGLNYERRLNANWGIGGTIMFDRWCDYLGMFGGKYAFLVIKPSFDLVYHLSPKDMDLIDPFAGTHLGYSFFWITNELGNSYEGDLRHEPYIAPFVGVNFRLGESAIRSRSRLLVTAKVAWSVTGRLSGLYGTIGIAFRFR